MIDERITDIPIPNECKNCIFSAFKQFQSRWIPVTEQTLPRENSTVVAIGKTATWDVGNYRGHAESNIHRWNWKKNTIKDVYWWMYKKDALPKPYERSEE